MQTLYMMETDGENDQKIADHFDTISFEVTPDGKRLVYIRDRASSSEQAPGIYSIHLEGMGVDLLYQLEEPVGLKSISDLTIAADGKNVLFSLRDPTDLKLDGLLLTAPLDGTLAVNRIGKKSMNGRVCWNLDGSKIFFVGTPVDNSGQKKN